MTSKRKRILLDASKLKTLNSGLGQFSLHLGNAICQNNTDFDLTFFVPAENDLAFGPQYSYVKGNKFKRVFGFGYQADIWHCFYQGTPYWPKNKATKVILTVHDLNFIYKYKGWRKWMMLRKLQQQVKLADFVVAISNHTKEEIKKYLKVDSAKLRMIYNGVTSSKATPSKPAFANSSKFLFALGIVSQKKNFHVLLSLMNHYDGTLIIAGDNGSAYANTIVEEAAKQGFSNRVILPGPISEEDKAWLYQNCEAFMFPSLTEGFGLPVIEAMALGKPVFISDKTSLPEIGGPYAYYFKDFSPEAMKETFLAGMEDYRSNPSKAEEIKRWASRFSWEESAKEYIKLYHSLAN